MNYKIEQLEKMLLAEQRQPENEKYGAHLTHWAGTSKPINLDEKAIKCLIKHYKNRLDKGGETMEKEISLRMKSGTLCATVSMRNNKETEKEYGRLSKMSSEELKKEFEMNDDITEELFVELN